MRSSRADALLWSRLLAGGLAWQMGGAGTVRVLRVRWNQHALRADQTSPHRHPFHQILYYSHGRGLQHLGEERRPIAAGSICFVPAGVRHSFVGTGRRAATCLTIDVDMEGGEGTEGDGWVLRQALATGERHVFPLSSRFQRQVGACMARINREVDSRQTGYATAVQGMLLELMALFLRATQVTPVFARGPERSWPGRGVVRRALEVAGDPLAPTNVTTPTLGRAAREVGVSPNHLNVLLRQQTGLTFRQLIIQRRIEAAKNLLRSSEDSCTEVAFACGFGDSNYFSRLFRRKTGVSPSEFRRRAR